MEVDVGKLLQRCRTCFSNNFLQMFEIFSKSTNNISIAELIYANTSIKVDEADYDFPRIICKNCFECLKNFQEFKKKALSINEALHNLKKHDFKNFNLLSTLPLEIMNESILCNNNIDIGNIEKNPKIQDLTKETDYPIKNFDDITVLTLHTPDKINVSDKKNKNHICTVCGQVFSKMSQLKVHLTEIHQIEWKKIKRKQVNKNPEETPSTTKLETEYKCVYCNDTYINMNALSAHMRKHVDKRNLTCTKCSKTFKKLSHLKRHELIHHNRFKCNCCKKIFLDENEYNKHIVESQHNESIPTLVCPICHKKFLSRANLYSHMKIHTEDPKHLCQACGKKFYSKGNLMQHVKRHYGEKDFCCSFCPERFVSKGELKNHIVVHTKEKCYSCNDCGVKFTRCTSLTQHRKKHRHVKTYKCDTCLLSFTTKNHLQTHQRKHTGERPYKCLTCGKAYYQACDLVKHKRKHFGDNIYKCEHCEAAFKFKRELRDHISEHYLKDSIVKKESIEVGDSIVLRETVRKSEL